MAERVKPREHPWLPADYRYSDVVAIQAVYAGTADPAQQRAALDWIINQAAETYGEPFRSDADGGARDTDYALGKAKVGREIVKMINYSPKLLAQMREKDAGN